MAEDHLEDANFLFLVLTFPLFPWPGDSTYRKSRVSVNLNVV